VKRGYSQSGVLSVIVSTWLGTTAARASAPPDAPTPGGAVRPARTKEAVAAASEKEEEHHTDLLYLKAETGAEYVGLQTLSLKRDLVPRTLRSDDVGPFGGAAMGVKLLFLSVGPRFRIAHFRDWDLWTLNLDAGWIAPLGKVEPHVMLSGGYARLGRAFDTFGRTVRVEGYDLRLVLGVDYFTSPHVSLGASVSGEALGMHRPGVDLEAQDGVVNDLYKFDGASAGLGFTGALGLGLHL
jgi:hypothetical protein